MKLDRIFVNVKQVKVAGCEVAEDEGASVNP